MSQPRMNHVLLKRGWREEKKDPLLEDVLALMKIVEADEAQDGPPDLTLEIINQGEGANRRAATMNLMLVFHAEEQVSWLVQFIAEESKALLYLATREPILDRFVIGTCCGLVEMFRKECLLEPGTLIREAVMWFLKHGTAGPSLTWLNYDDVVRPCG
jgi:hypothetical protein